MNKNIAVIGLGYVGLPIAAAFSRENNVVGFDINSHRVNELANGYDRTNEISKQELEQLAIGGFTLTSALEDLKSIDYYIVTVPTPIDNENRPDLSPLIEASKMIATVLEEKSIVIYESTVYPGVTEEVCVPLLEQGSGLVFNSDFFVGYSPERINPGDPAHSISEIPKITSGSTEQIAEQVDSLYKTIIRAGTHKCRSIRVAEASKVIENTQRDVNIALINEFAMIFREMNIDTSEVLAAAETKWNFISLRPGLVGGHCIGVDPYYLTYKAQELGYKPNLILSARQINNGMGKYVAEQVIKLMIDKRVKIRDSRVLVLGFSFKENCPDVRNTRVIDVIRELTGWGCLVDVYDPLVNSLEVSRENNINMIDCYDFDKYSGIIVAVAHDDFRNLSIPEREDRVIFDIKSILSSNVDGKL